MADSDYVTRSEFNMLVSRVDNNEHRLENLDNSGTRGVLALSTQMADVIKDMTEMKVEFGHRFDQVDDRFRLHDLVHAQELRDRITGRRWLVGVGVAALGSLGAIFAVLVEILSHFH